MNRVVNIADHTFTADSVLITRPGPWGNPYRLSVVGGRDAAIAMHMLFARRMLAQDPDWLAPLRGQTLVCHCAPKACHGDNLLQLLKERYVNE